MLVAPPQVIFVVCQGQRPTQSDFDSAKRLIDGSFRRFSDVHFIFLTNDRQQAHDLMKDRWPRQSRWRDRQYQVIATDSTDISNVEKQIYDAFNDLPRRIIAQIPVPSIIDAPFAPWNEVLHK